MKFKLLNLQKNLQLRMETYWALRKGDQERVISTSNSYEVFGQTS